MNEYAAQELFSQFEVGGNLNNITWREKGLWYLTL